MKEWKRKIVSLLTVSMLLGSYAQTAVYAAEPEDVKNVTEATDGAVDPVEQEPVEETVSADETEQPGDMQAGTEEEWIKDFEYELSDKGAVTLTKYIGTSDKLTIPAKAVIDGKEYSVELGYGVFYENIDPMDLYPSDDRITEISFVGGVKGYGCEFARLTSLKKLDLSGYVLTHSGDGEVNTEDMFSGCVNLTDLDISSLNTAGVVNMGNMFYNCKSLEKIDLSKFDTSKVVEMSGMFAGCSGLKELNLGKFNTSKVILMIGMFEGCSSLTELDLSKFNTKSVTNMGSMFSGCSALKKIDMSSFNTEELIVVDDMFNGCKSLSALDLSNFDLKEIDNYGSTMLGGCEGLERIETPINIPDGVKIVLEEKYYDSVGNEYDELPHSSKSMTLTREYKMPVVDGSGSALDTQPVLDQDTIELTLVKGQKFVLGDDQWTSSDKKVLAISKTKATAKKAGTVTLTHGAQTVKVTIIAPAFDSKSVKMTAGEEKSISLNNASGLDILYVSLSPDVAVVDEDGTVTAISKGSAVINAYVNGAAYKYTVKVSDADTSKRDFTKPVELKPMQSVSVKLSGFKASKAAWSSETQVSANELPKGSVFADSVVKISKSGKITAIGAGETVLTATGGSAEPIVITIRVSEPLERTMHINVNDKKPLRLYGVKGNVEWKPAEDGIVTVEKNKVKALKAGDTVLTAKVEGFTYTVTVYIEDAAVTTEGISGKKNKYTLELNAGCSAQLSFASLYQQVAFKSSDCSVAYADEDGVIHARKAGSAKLSGKISGKAVTITVKVQKYDEKAASLEEYVKSKGFTVYGYGSERYSDTDKSVHQNLPKPYKVLWHAKLPNPEFPAENLAYVRLVEITDGMISIDVFSSVYDGVNMLCPMEVACEVIDKLVNDPYVETTEGGGPFYYFPPYSQYIKYDFAEL